MVQGRRKNHCYSTGILETKNVTVVQISNISAGLISVFRGKRLLSEEISNFKLGMFIESYFGAQKLRSTTRKSLRKY